MLMIRRLGLAAVAALSLSLALPASAHAISPINPNNRPSPVPGQLNGVLPAPLLVKVAPHCRALARRRPESRPAVCTGARVAHPARRQRVLPNAGIRGRQRESTRTSRATIPRASRPSGKRRSGAPVGHSYHGWGKAVDLTDAGDTLTFADPGYAFMKRTAASLGWNHPAFAEPGGSTCPEPWHWEWVGDGGQSRARLRFAATSSRCCRAPTITATTS